MSFLLDARNKLTDFYAKGETFILPFLKFLLSFAVLLIINTKLGFMYRITSPALAMIVALLCSFLPANMIIFFASAFVVLHIYALSLEGAVVVAVLFLLLYLLYFRFSPRDSLAVLLTPLCFALKVPFVIPLAAGFIGTPLSAISVGCGVIAYYVISYFSINASTLSNLDLESAVAKFKYIVDALLSDKTMLVMIAVFAVTVILVYIVKQLSFDHSWKIALALGTVACAVMLFMGNVIMDLKLSAVGLLIEVILSALLVVILQFFVFCVDYSRTERVQFEDDEYYYYVKAVPKISVPSSQKKIKHISEDDMDDIFEEKTRKRARKTETIDDDDVRVVKKSRY